MSMHRFAAALVALATFVVSGCQSNATEPIATNTTGSPTPSTTMAARLDCLVDAPDDTGIDAAFEDLSGFTVKPICPADLPYPLSQMNLEFDELNAAELGENGSPIMKVMAGQLNSGSGDAFVDKFLSELAATGEEYHPPRALASGPPRDVGGYQVTYFHLTFAAEGYAFAEGPTVVIVYNVAGPPMFETVEDALVTILTNV